MFSPDTAHLLTIAQNIPLPPLPVQPVTVAYLGPNTVLPIASVLAAAIGVILMFWRYFMTMARKTIKTVLRREAEPVPTETHDEA